jgi:molybdopterin-binding protein
MPSELIGVRDAARRLGVSYPTLKQWIYKGALRTVQTAGGHHRIAESEIERFLARRRTGPNRKSTSPSRRRSDSPAVLVALSGRNQLRGIVEEVRADGLMAQIRLRIGDQSLTAIITRDAIDALRLKRGEEAVAVIKSTEVMVGRGETKGRGRRAEGRGQRAEGRGQRAEMKSKK